MRGSCITVCIPDIITLDKCVHLLIYCSGCWFIEKNKIKLNAVDVSAANINNVSIF